MPDQQSGCSSVASAASQPQQQHHQQQQQQQHRSPFLRRCSISEPHLDIVPHFVKEEKKDVNPFNRVFSGLFDKGSTFSVNSTDSVDHHHHHAAAAAAAAAGSLFSPKSDHFHDQLSPHQLTKGKSAVGMISEPAPFVPTAGGGPSDGLRKSATSVSALYSTSPQATHHFPTIPEDQGGLTMSAGRISDKSSPNKAMMGSIPGASSPPKSGFMNLFGTGGFLSRPVLHSPEENYRIIMALDR
uniref:VQ domain-containing protein n=1 Tax=Globodera pallida TaxID=36090 RepID=A0A183CCE0_GLOPA